MSSIPFKYERECVAFGVLDQSSLFTLAFEFEGVTIHKEKNQCIHQSVATNTESKKGAKIWFMPLAAVESFCYLLLDRSVFLV